MWQQRSLRGHPIEDILEIGAFMPNPSEAQGPEICSEEKGSRAGSAGCLPYKGARPVLQAYMVYLHFKGLEDFRVVDLFHVLLLSEQPSCTIVWYNWGFLGQSRLASRRPHISTRNFTQRSSWRRMRLVSGPVQLQEH